MAVIKDPENNDKTTLLAMVDLKNNRILEVGCGDGRLTWHYAGKTAHVTAIDPDSEAIQIARSKVPDRLKGKINFLASSIEDFTAAYSGEKFDIAIYSWSL